MMHGKPEVCIIIKKKDKLEQNGDKKTHIVNMKGERKKRRPRERERGREHG
jgi:hypothetical protein